MSGGPSDDVELVRRCLAADEEAWASLVERYADYIYAVAIRGFRFTPEEAEEVLQETFAHVYEHLADYRGTGALRAWLGAIGKNVARQRLRSRSRHPESELPQDAADSAQQQALEAVEESLLVKDALARLEPPCGEVLRRFFVMEQKYAEIASAMQIPEGTVASRIARCLVRLRKALAVPESRAGRTGRPPASV